MKTKLLFAVCSLSLPFALAEPAQHPLIVEIVAIEVKREAELAKALHAQAKGEEAAIGKYLAAVNRLESELHGPILALSRKMLAGGRFAGEESAIEMLVGHENEIKEMAETIQMAKAKGLDTDELSKVLIPLEKTRDIWKSRAIADGIFMLSVERVNRLYPAMLDEESEFHRRVQVKIDAAIENDDEILADPRHVLYFSRTVEMEMKGK